MINVISLINNAKEPNFYRIKNTNIVGVLINNNFDIRIWDNQEIKVSLIDTKVLHLFSTTTITKKQFKTAYREFLKNLDNVKKNQNEGL